MVDMTLMKTRFFAAVYLASVFCMTAFAICCSVLVVCLHHTEPPRPIPHWVRCFVLNGLGRLFCMVDSNKVHDVSEKVVDNVHLTDNDGPTDNDNEKVCHLHLYHIFVTWEVLMVQYQAIDDTDISEL